MKVMVHEKGILLIGSVREVRKKLKADSNHFLTFAEWIENQRKNGSAIHTSCSLPNSSLK